MPSHSDMHIAENATSEIEETPGAAADRRGSLWLRVLRGVLLGMLTQYIIIAATVGLPLAAALRYYVTPLLLANFEAVAKALNR